MDIKQEKVYDLLYRLGATAHYTGFCYTACAVRLCAERQERLLLVTKRLYPEVAKQYKTNWRAVERNIRTIISVAWKNNRALLEKLARRPLGRKPCATEFLAILSAAVLRGEAA